MTGEPHGYWMTMLLRDMVSKTVELWTNFYRVSHDQRFTRVWNRDRARRRVPINGIAFYGRNLKCPRAAQRWGYSCIGLPR